MEHGDGLPPRLHGGGPGSEVSRGDLLQDRQSQGLVGDNPREAQIVLPLQALGLIPAQPAVLFLPAIAGLLGDAELPTGVQYRQALAGVELNCPQMLNDLFGRIPASWA